MLVNHKVSDSGWWDPGLCVCAGHCRLQPFWVALSPASADQQSGEYAEGAFRTSLRFPSGQLSPISCSVLEPEQPVSSLDS